jgi:hypothetical protein
LPGAQVLEVVNAARKNKIVYRSPAPLKPGNQALAAICHQCKLDGATSLFLNDSGAVSDTATADNIADL